VTPPERPTDQPTTAADDVAAYRSRLAHLIGIDRGRVAREAPSLPSPATFLLEETIAELQAIEDELREQNDALLDAKLAVEERGLEFQRLFEYAPMVYLVTDRHAVIVDANVAATHLLRRAKNALIGKPLVNFVPVAMRPAFRAAVNHACAGGTPEEWPIRLLPQGTSAVDVIFTVAAAPGHAPNHSGGRPALYWLARPDSRRDVEDLL